MGWFSAVKYSTVEHHLPEIEVKKRLTYIHVPSLEHHPEREKLIQDTILARRRGDGKISLQQVYELLTRLKECGQIFKNDRKGVMQVLQKYFQKIGSV